MPGLAHGKMYKCGTFGGILPFTPESFRVCESHFKELQQIKQCEMEKVKKELRKHFVKTRMNDTELNHLGRLQQKSTDKDLSNYIRKVLLQKPVTINYRNQSADDFLKQMLELKKELNAIGNNFNQAVHKLHLLDKIPEFRQWIQQYDGLHQAFINKTEQISFKVNELYEKWLLK